MQFDLVEQSQVMSKTVTSWLSLSMHPPSQAGLPLGDLKDSTPRTLECGFLAHENSYFGLKGRWRGLGKNSCRLLRASSGFAFVDGSRRERTWVRAFVYRILAVGEGITLNKP